MTTTRFSKVLIANRGEIALRIMKTCRSMGLRTVAVFSDADEAAPHVRFADEAVRIGPAPSAESYLKREAILRAAALTGAQAIHPGYGFLSENPDFAQACVDAGLVFIGPTPKAIRAMGLKREAKALVGARGVPLVPGFDGGDQTVATLKAKALEVGLPVIFKPSAGGGGKGMKVARTEAELEAAISSGQREAASSFGDATLIIEKFLERPRHLEVQLLGDHHGNVVHVFERECSIQRRHQKVIEESPAPGLSAEKRAALGKAAVEVARAIGYTNAGTVEFIADEKGEFYFSEMNTRLQVEHRVTEMVTGLDLVEQQLRIAQGEPLRFTQEQLSQRGHAIEVRLCAEEPAMQFMPSPGPVLDFHVQDLPGVIVDTGVEAGGEVSSHYDSMVAKLIAWGETREAATAKLVNALDQLSVLGLKTNQGFLKRLLQQPAFAAGQLHTQFIEQHFGGQLDEPADARRGEIGLAAAVIASIHRRASNPSTVPHVPSGFRNNRWADQQLSVSVGGTKVDLSYRVDGTRVALRVSGVESVWRVIQAQLPVLELESADGVRHRTRVVTVDDTSFVHTLRGPVTVKELPRFPDAQDASSAGGFIAPMPGKVVKVLVTVGERVKRGQTLLVLEAMKMEQTTTAPKDGVVKQLLVKEGQQVTAGQALIVVDDA